MIGVEALNPHYRTAVLDGLQDMFPESDFALHERLVFELEDGTELCPDAAIVSRKEPGEVCCVADLRVRSVLHRFNVEKVAKYKQRLDAKRACIFVPHGCEIASDVRELADGLGIELCDNVAAFPA
jgi:hypothetical protein